MSAFSTDKANQEFELKFTAHAVLLLNVTEPIANKNALYHQLGMNLAAARRAIELLQGEEAHAVVEQGGTLAEDVWTAALSTMAELWTKYKPQEVADRCRAAPIRARLPRICASNGTRTSRIRTRRLTLSTIGRPRRTARLSLR